MMSRRVLAPAFSMLLLACSSSSSSTGDGGTTQDAAGGDDVGTATEGGGGDDSGSGSDSGSMTHDASTGDAASSNDASGDALAVGADGGPVSIACYISGQDRCHEYPQATADQLTNLPIECSSASGVLSMPAACPTTGFLGKCTIGTGGGADVTRWYSPADATYQMSYCASPANGAWSTTF